MKNPNQTDKLLFTPGPLTTSDSVKAAMLHDAGSWHVEFNDRVRWIRTQLLSLAGLSQADGWEAVLLQGSGSYGVEAVFSTCVPPDGKVCVVTNGAYGERMIQTLERLQIPHAILRSPENEPPDLALLNRMLSTDPGITHLAAVHCETTTGIFNPIAEIGTISRRHCCLFIVDAMSSFGGVPIDFDAAGIDFLISSANKCLEGVPGLCFVLARRETILSNERHARSLSLNLADQLRAFERSGQFRFTPPTHVILALEQALREFLQEGGVAARQRRYQLNHAALIDGMQSLGFKPFLRPEIQGWIITAFQYPDDPRFQFVEFYDRLSQKGFLIYPGKLTGAETFRIANIGHLFAPDLRALLAAIAAVQQDMGFSASRAEASADPCAKLHALPLFL